MSQSEALELKKLTLQVEELRGKTSFIGRLTPIVSVVLAVGAFSFGTYQYFQDRLESREALDRTEKREQRLRDRELFKPIWERQIAIYMEASDVVAMIATTSDAEARTLATEKFWKLYQGPLIIFENKGVANGMIDFGDCLSGKINCKPEELITRSRTLATQIQLSLSDSWNQGLGNFAEGKFKYHLR
jgi:hypothetical protein